MLYDWVQNQHCQSFAFKVEAFVLYFRLKPFWPLLKCIFHLFRAHWCALKKKSTWLWIGKFHLEWEIQKHSACDENYRFIRMFEEVRTLSAHGGGLSGSVTSCSMAWQWSSSLSSSLETCRRAIQRENQFLLVSAPLPDTVPDCIEY